MKKYLLLFLFLLFTGCASFLKTQEAMVVDLRRGDVAAARTIADKADYGARNTLLASLDKGLVYHLAGDYPASIEAFNRSRRLFEEVYALSVTQMTESFLLNDYSIEYRGEDYERALLNVFNALNYLFVGNVSDSLVEIRDLDDHFKATNSDSGFARLIGGIIYQAGSRHDLNDAYVSLRKAYEVYRLGYNEIAVPRILQEDLLTLANEFDRGQFRKYRSECADVAFSDLEHRRTTAQVYLLDYFGRAPAKEESSLIVPIPGDQRIIKVAFPVYPDKHNVYTPVVFEAKDSQGKAWDVRTQAAEDIDSLARKALAARKKEKIAKTLARNAARYAAQEKFSDTINEKHGGDAALAFDIASGIFNAVVERADLRSWRTLPAMIGVARLEVPPGRYVFYAGGRMLREISVEAGKVYLLTDMRGN